MKKRILSIFFTLVLTLLLCACSTSTDIADQSSDSAGTLPRLKIGVASYKPYFYLGKDGNYTGIDKDIATEACERLGYQPVFVETTWNNQDTLLERGDIDCIWGRFSMSGRADVYQWTDPYLHSAIVICVRADSDIHTLKDLAGKTVAVMTNSRVEHYFLQETELTAPAIEKLYTYDSPEYTFAAFNKGYTDAVAGHKAGLKEYTKDKPSLYRFLDEPLYIADLGVAFSKDYDSAFVDQLSQTLKEMNKDGFIPAVIKDYDLDSVNILEVDADETK